FYVNSLQRRKFSRKERLDVLDDPNFPRRGRPLSENRLFSYAVSRKISLPRNHERTFFCNLFSAAHPRRKVRWGEREACKTMREWVRSNIMIKKPNSLIEELYQAPEKAEIVDGEIVRMSPASSLHGWAAKKILVSLDQHEEK